MGFEKFGEVKKIENVETGIEVGPFWDHIKKIRKRILTTALVLGLNTFSPDSASAQNAENPQCSTEAFTTEVMAQIITKVERVEAMTPEIAPVFVEQTRDSSRRSGELMDEIGSFRAEAYEAIIQCQQELDRLTRRFSSLQQMVRLGIANESTQEELEAIPHQIARAEVALSELREAENFLGYMPTVARAQEYLEEQRRASSDNR